MPTGLDMETAEVVAPAVAQPFEHVGASGVHISGLNITHTAAQYMLPYDNPSRGDWTIYRGGAVYFEDSHNCTVTNCFFDQVRFISHQSSAWVICLFLASVSMADQLSNNALCVPRDACRLGATV
eukprot:COSAG06_NODE_5669_length_3331_cov_2.810496_5_plen_125_part_00